MTTVITKDLYMYLYKSPYDVFSGTYANTFFIVDIREAEFFVYDHRIGALISSS